MFWLSRWTYSGVPGCGPAAVAACGVAAAVSTAATKHMRRRMSRMRVWSSPSSGPRRVPYPLGCNAKRLCCFGGAGRRRRGCLTGTRECASLRRWPVTRSVAGATCRRHDREEHLMGLLRRNDFDGTRYRMREKLLAIGDDFWIDTDEDRHAFKVNGKALRLRSTFVLESASGEELLKIQEKKLSIRDTMKLERGGETVGTVKKALITPL